MRLVLDCNVVIAAARTEGVCRSVISEAVRRHAILLSSPILEEYREVASRPKHSKCRGLALSMIEQLTMIAEWVAPCDPLPALPDPDDAVYLATAFAGRADALITGNTKHFPTDLCTPVGVLTPREFLDLSSRDGEIPTQACT